MTKGGMAPTELLGPLRSLIDCPHCWSRFSVADTLWIAEHPDLVADPCLGTDALEHVFKSGFGCC